MVAALRVFRREAELFAAARFWSRQALAGVRQIKSCSAMSEQHLSKLASVFVCLLILTHPAKAQEPLPAQIFLQFCSNHAGVLRYPQPIRIEVRDYSQIDKELIRNIFFGIYEIARESHLSFSYEADSLAASKSTSVFIILPETIDANGLSIIDNIIKDVVEIYKGLKEPIDSVMLKKGILYQYDGGSGRYNIAIMERNRPKYTITFVRLPGIRATIPLIVAIDLVSDLGFNGDLPQIEGTVFAKKGGVDTFKSVGPIEFSYLRELYALPGEGNFMCKKTDDLR